MTVAQQDSCLVLIVDDDRFMRIQLRSMMEDEGYEVAEARDGEEGLAAYTSYKPDIVLLDALMPAMDGFTCCYQMRELPSSDRIPILMITCLEDEKSVDRAFDVGATDYITKPIHWAVLRQRVRRLLLAARATEELQQHFLRERLIGRIAQRIRQSLNLEEILNTAAAEVRQFLACDRVLFYRLWPDGSGRVVSEAVVPGWPMILGKDITDPCFQQGYLEQYRQGRTRAIADLEQAGLQSCHVKFLQQFGVKANLVVPILQGEALWGLLIAHHCTGPRRWFSYDVELLQQLTSQVSIALAQAQYLETIRESEEKFRQLAENIREVFFLTSRDRILYISPAYEEIWGCTCESLYKQPDSWFDLVHPEDRERLLAGCREQKQSGKALNEEYRIVRADGDVRWIRTRTFPLRNETGQIYRIPGISEDITDHKKAQEEIYQALEKEKELSELKSRFVTTTSHEFRTPLTTILSSAELLEYYGSQWNEEEKCEHLHRIQAAVKSMTRLLEEVLVFGKTEAGKLEFNPAPLNLKNLCCSLIEEVQFSSGSNHTINFVSQGCCLNTCMDEKLLKHIFSNLLSNAIKYSPQGGKVDFELVCQQEEAIVSIKDEGIGIPAREQLQVFHPFERASNVGTISGTGLGLAIVKSCVELHRGKIAVASKVGVGTKFIVTLPLNN